jgi:hypothetical protein
MWRYFIFTILLYLLASCSEVEENAPQTEIHPTVKLSESVPLGNGFTSGTHPTISHVLIVDLDQDGRQDVLACDVLGQQVSWIRQARDDEFVEEVILSGVNGAVHVEAVDFENDVDLDVLVAAMGAILPIDARMGQVIILENDEDGDLDLAIA